MKPALFTKPAEVASKERRISSQQLFDGHTRLRIEHQGDAYLLQLTRQGKLILTK